MEKVYRMCKIYEKMLELSLMYLADSAMLAFYCPVILYRKNIAQEEQE